MIKFESEVTVDNREFKHTDFEDEYIYRQMAVRAIDEMPFEKLSAMFEFRKIDTSNTDERLYHKGGCFEEWRMLIAENKSKYMATLIVND